MRDVYNLLVLWLKVSAGGCFPAYRLDTFDQGTRGGG